MRNDKTFVTLGWILVFCFAFGGFAFVTADPDLWGHVKYGEDIWQHKSLHKTDPYSFVAFGLPWINHEWLTELAFYGLWAAFSSSGLLVFKLLVGFAVAFLVMRTSGKEQFVPLIRAGSVLLCLAAASRAFMVRPQLFSVLLFALFWFVLHGYLIKKENRLYLLPLLMALWVNFHGGFLMGLAVMGAVAAGESLEAFWSSASRPRAVRLWFWFLLCWGATFINPYGWGLHEWLSHSLSSPRQISEWMPISLSILDHWEIKLITALVLLAVMYKGKQNRPWEIAVMLLLLYAAWKHQRHSPFLGIVAAPFLASSLSALWNSKVESRMRASITPRSRAWVAGLMLFACLWFAGRGAVIYSATGMKIFVDPLRYPVYAANFLATNQIKGNLFTVFDWSQYAIWKRYPESQVFIDGRFRTVYPEEVLNDYFSVNPMSNDWQFLLEKYPPDIILAPQLPYFQNLINQQDSPFQYIYSDLLSIIFIAKEGVNQDILELAKENGLIYPRDEIQPYFP